MKQVVVISLLVIGFLALQISSSSIKDPKDSTGPSASPPAGGKTKINKADEVHIKQLLKDNLHKLRTGDKPVLRLKNIDSGDKQVVQGIRYVIVADLYQGKKEVRCEITLLERVWLEEPNKLIISATCHKGVKL